MEGKETSRICSTVRDSHPRQVLPTYQRASSSPHAPPSTNPLWRSLSPSPQSPQEKKRRRKADEGFCSFNYQNGIGTYSHMRPRRGILAGTVPSTHLQGAARNKPFSTWWQLISRAASDTLSPSRLVSFPSTCSSPTSSKPKARKIRSRRPSTRPNQVRLSNAGGNSLLQTSWRTCFHFTSDSVLITADTNNTADPTY